MRTICRTLMLIGVVLLSACHTTRHTVSEVGVVQDEQSSHQEQTTTQRLDSLFSKLSVSADSITIDLYDSAPPALPQADSLAANPNAQAQPATAKPARKGRITIHQPRINKEERRKGALPYISRVSTKRKGVARMCFSRPTWPIAHGAIPKPTHPPMTLKRSSVALNHQT